MRFVFPPLPGTPMYSFPIVIYILGSAYTLSLYLQYRLRTVASHSRAPFMTSLNVKHLKLPLSGICRVLVAEPVQISQCLPEPPSSPSTDRQDHPGFRQQTSLKSERPQIPRSDTYELHKIIESVKSSPITPNIPPFPYITADRNDNPPFLYESSDNSSCPTFPASFAFCLSCQLYTANWPMTNRSKNTVRSAPASHEALARRYRGVRLGARMDAEYVRSGLSVPVQNGRWNQGTYYL